MAVPKTPSSFIWSMSFSGDRNIVVLGKSVELRRVLFRSLGVDVDVAPGGDRSPAVFLRDGRPEDAELLHLVNELLRVLVGVLQLADDRAHLIVDKLADSRDD